MNCEEVMEVLDNDRHDRIDAGRRRLITAHVAVCDACARAWNLQSALAALPDIAMPGGLAAQCRMLVAAAREPLPVAGNARPLRLIGAVAALAAAAAVLVFVLRPDPDAPVPVQQGAEAEITTTADVEAPSDPDARPVQASVVAAAPEPQFTVRLLPPEQDFLLSSELARANSVDPSRERSMQALHAALVEGLRKLPALSLVDSDPAEVDSTRKHFCLKLGLISIFEHDGRPMPVDPRFVDVALSASELQAGGKSVNHMGPMARVDVQANCFGSAPGDAPCNDVPSVAATMIQRLIRDVFPPSPSMTGPLQAQFRDASVDVAQRLQALEELYKLQARVGDTRLLRDPGVVRSAIALAATGDAVLRARLWRTLKGAGNVELIQPLLASLVEEAEDTRLAALETLSADFLSDPRVRIALEATSVGDQRPLVRAVAMRGLSGETAWRQYVTSSLKDPDLPASQRVEALVYHLYPPGPTRATSSIIPGYFDVMGELLDDEAVRAFAEVAPDSGGLGRGANNLLGNFAARFRDHPAVPEMMLRVLRDDPKAVMRAVAADHLGRLHASEPRVREMLIKARDSDPDARVREISRSWLAKLP